MNLAMCMCVHDNDEKRNQLCLTCFKFDSLSFSSLSFPFLPYCSLNKKKTFLTHYHRTMNLYILCFFFLSCRSLTIYYCYNNYIYIFLIRFKDRKLHQRSALQAQICLSCNEKREKKIVFKTLSVYLKDLWYALAHDLYLFLSSLNLRKRLPVLPLYIYMMERICLQPSHQMNKR